ncbi:MAG TPA: amidohydrolase family protein [Tepidisphaeraceae bacterium]|nr:amidohydrolase family protein [Tepidisphaeraceae bacterium]
MLYDVHTHVGADMGFLMRGWWPYAATSGDLLTAMDANGIDRAVVFPFTLPSAFDVDVFAAGQGLKLRSERFPFDRENPLLAGELAMVDTDKRLMQFGMFDPAREVGKQIENLKSLIGKIAGLKCQTTILQSPIKQLLGDARGILELAQENNLPVLFHTAINPADSWAQVADCLEVAAAFPKVRFNLAHSLRFWKKGLEQAAKMDNVWVDCSAHLVHCQLAQQGHPAVAVAKKAVAADYSKPGKVLEAVGTILGSKYMWGSDNPFMSWCDKGIRAVYRYKQETDVLHGLPGGLKRSMGTTGPEAWLFGK